MRRQAAQFEELATRVVTISFGPASKAAAYLEETGSPFELLIDAKREVYKAYGMRHSLSGALSLKALRQQRELVRQGAALHGVQGDALQLGGDVVVDAGGILRLVHRSTNPADNESPETLLRLLASLQRSSGPQAADRPAAGLP